MKKHGLVIITTVSLVSAGCNYYLVVDSSENSPRATKC